jgi:hypothetical protein
MKKLILILSLFLGLGIACIAQPAVRMVTVPITEVLKNTTNETTDTVFTPFEMGGYSAFSLELNGSGGVTYDAFATLDETVSNSDTTNWVPYNTDLFGTADRSDSHLLRYNKGVFVPVKVMIRSINSDNTNSNKIIVSKY